MKVLVLGGKLQGVEIIYLAQEAGWHVTMVDKDRTALGSCLCDHFICDDLYTVDALFFSNYDIVFPAIEDIRVLRHAARLAEEAGVPFVFDERAYMLSCSKIRTNDFLEYLGVAIPPLIEEAADFQEDMLPCIAKPDIGSGSKGVRVFRRPTEAFAFIKNNEGYFVQEFLHGPIYSIEAVCNRDDVRSFVVTEVVIDATYDCHRIVAPCRLPAELSDEIKFIASAIGKALDMQGIFDIELVLHDSRLYVLEIDARMPSQTPIAIYHATGINLVYETIRCFLDIPSYCDGDDRALRRSAHVILQHVCVDRPRIHADTIISLYGLGDAGGSVLVPFCCPSTSRQSPHVFFIGEGQLAVAPPLKKSQGFYGTDSALISENMDLNRLYATLVTSGQTEWVAQQKMVRALKQLVGREEYRDKTLRREYRFSK